MALRMVGYMSAGSINPNSSDGFCNFGTPPLASCCVVWLWYSSRIRYQALSASTGGGQSTELSKLLTGIFFSEFWLGTLCVCVCVCVYGLLSTFSELGLMMMMWGFQQKLIR